MIVLENELHHISERAGVCEQCGEFMYGRYITGGDSIFGGASRGTFFICYDCIRPVRRWKESPASITFETPVGRKEYEDEIERLGGRPNTRST